ncbi:MAG: MotA/TolQ/ExbB proton channel family protein [Kofleriaceae bacterium]
MIGFVQGWGLTALMLVVITLVFAGALLHLAGELRWVRALTDYLGAELVGDPASRRGGGLDVEAIRDDAHAVWTAADPAWAQKQVRSWQMRTLRLEPSLAFWVDLLRQLGLLGTVLGLGLSLAVAKGEPGALLGPLALAVWTTIAGLGFSIVLTSVYGMRLTAWVDACEKNLEAWDTRRRARHEA